MGIPSVELVTLSDSPTSAIRRPKRKKGIGDQEPYAGAPKIVCLDSDTESDGSRETVKKLALTATNDEVCYESNECKNGRGKWLGLRMCDSHIKRLNGDHSVSPKENLEEGIHKINAIQNFEGLSNVVLDAMTKGSLEKVDLTDGVPYVGDHIDMPDVDHLILKPYKDSSDIDFCSIPSPVTSLDQCFSLGNSHLHNSITSPASCEKVRRPASPSATVGFPENCSPCLSSASKDSANCRSLALDDSVKNIITKGSSKAVSHEDNCWKYAHEKQWLFEDPDHDSDDEIYHGDYSFLKNITEKGEAGDATARVVQDCCKRLEETIKWGSCELDKLAKNIGNSTSMVDSTDDSVSALDKEMLTPKKRGKQIKDKEKKDAKKQRRKLEIEGRQEEKRRHQELRKLQNEEEKKRKEVLKAEAAEKRKLEKEKLKWEKGKFALQNITVFVDAQILEAGLLGGLLLTRLAEKGFKYHIVRNPVKKTVVWQMKLPSKELQMDLQEECLSHESLKPKLSKNVGSQLCLETVDVSYVVIVLEAKEFLDMITNNLLDSHIKDLQRSYPGFTLCYLINRLMSFLQKREQQHYKTPGDNWHRPPVEQVLAKLVTSYDGVHSRPCVDEAEISEHIVGLTRSLAECPFKHRLTPLSLSANGDHIVKNDPYNDVIKRDVWSRALVALPKVSGSCAVAISSKYPSMSALFEAYLDPVKTVYEKEHLLQGLIKEGLLGPDQNRRIGPVCSKRIFRVLMAEQGNLLTNDAEEGADAFRD